jgi:DeoR/GlpR family transcriptional regulator of sugar metabolism
MKTEERILELLTNRRMNIRDIANELNLHSNTVRRFLRKLWRENKVSRIVIGKTSKANLPIYAMKTAKEIQEQEENDFFVASG